MFIVSLIIYLLTYTQFCKSHTFGLRLQHENGTPQASLLPTSREEQLK